MEPASKRVCIHEFPPSLSRTEFLQSLPLFRELFVIIVELPPEVLDIIIDYIFQVSWNSDDKSWNARERITFKRKHFDDDDGPKWCERVFIQTMYESPRLRYSDSNGRCTDDDNKLTDGSGKLTATGEPELTDLGWIYPHGVELINDNGKTTFRGRSLFPLSGIEYEYDGGQVVHAKQRESNVFGESTRVYEERYQDEKLYTRIITRDGAFLEISTDNLHYVDDTISVWICLLSEEPGTYRICEQNRWFGTAYYGPRDMMWKYIEISNPSRVHQIVGCNLNGDLWSVQDGTGRNVVEEPIDIVDEKMHTFREDSFVLHDFSSHKERKFWHEQLQFDLEHSSMPEVQLCLKELSLFRAARNDKQLTLLEKRPNS
jgi:hypothetical protein